MKGTENLCHETFLLSYFIKVNIKTNILEDYVDYFNRSLREHANFVDTTRQQNIYYKIINFLVAIIVSLFFLTPF